jgi:glycosyltransferase involved in cell wall biosynthesis
MQMHASSNLLTMSKITVIIPSFNCERYIRQTLDSVLAQTHPDLEVLVIDDGSTDGTPAIIESYGEPVRLVLRKNGGVCRARNAGITMARGDFICLLDHDDYWYPDKLARQVQALCERPDAGVAYSTFRPWVVDPATRVHPSPSTIDPSASGDGIDDDFSGWIYHHLLMDCYVLTSTAMFRREVFERCGGFDESLPYSEDWDLWLRISRVYPFVKLRTTTTLYRFHASQGNRWVRPVDYRTQLLHAAVRRWGYASPDGRRASRWGFWRQLALYHRAYACTQLQAGHLGRGLQSLWAAWTCFPVQPKPLGMMGAALLGWRAAGH